jgi:cytochrome c5
MRTQFSSLAVLSAVVTFASSPVLAAQSGEAVYQTVCSKCHANGNDNAPVFGDRKRWGKLVREGLNDLVPAALTGIRKMPPKGGTAELSDAEVAAAVIYMANAGGGKFDEPNEADLARWRQKADKRLRK